MVVRQLAGGGVSVVQFDLDESLLDLDTAVQILNAEEHARAARYRFDIHRDRFIQGRAMMRNILAELTEIADPRDLVIATGEHGKPCLPTGQLHFNLSHSGSHAVLGWSMKREIGIDVEAHDRTIDVDGLAAQVFTAKERAALEMPSALDKTRRFFSYWTAKEARMKATGEGMSLPPDQIALRLSDGQPIGYDKPVSPLVALEMVDFSDNISCAVAIVGGSPSA